MRRIVGFAIVAFVLAWAPLAHADSISVQYTDPLTGYEWADLNDTLGFSSNEMYAVCPKKGEPCSGTVNSTDFTGWIWADWDPLRELLYNVTATVTVQGEETVEEVNSTWAPLLIEALGETFGTGSGALQAWTYGQDGGGPNGYVFWLQDSLNPLDTDSIGISYHERDAKEPNLGVLLHRPRKVPEPASGALLIAGLIGLLGIRRLTPVALSAD